MNWTMRFRNILIVSSIAATCAMTQSIDGGYRLDTLPVNNTLTSQEQADGYVLLWNGLDFTGWKTNSSTTNPGNPGSNWAIVSKTNGGLDNGDSHKSTNPDSNMLEVAGSGNSIFTNDSTYLNFDWKVEWQAVQGLSGNAGLLYYYKVSVNTGNNYSAPEYQLCNSEFTSEWKTLTTTAGTNYLITAMLPGRRNADLSPSWVQKEGHWNQSRVISWGARAAHYGNGLRLLEYRKGSTQWNAAYAASKYNGLGVYNTVHSGSFFLQDHGEKWMKYRNIRVKKLTQNPWGPTSPYINRDSAARGDTTLIDTLSFSTNLFPVGGTGVSSNTIVPRYQAKIVANKDGLSVFFSEQGDYTISVEDVRGFRYSAHAVQHSDRFFLPGHFANSPRILTIWKDGKKIRESIVKGK
ncbi:MAG TPA: hypothetical protein DCQ83_07385 [Fibrobacteres bacterium]|jgi:hypothetical protein|nr:hypothetical protein [Fibrobacterota bacterium]